MISSPAAAVWLVVVGGALLPVTAALTLEDCTSFLRAHMSFDDQRTLGDAFVRESCAQALGTRTAFPWGRDIPDLIFLNDVAPYASLLEPRDAWRATDLNFTAFMAEQVAGCADVPCAAAALNARAWALAAPPIAFVAAPPNVLNLYAPLETLRRAQASCTGLAIFLVDALRAVGVPARVAGTPHWALGPRACPRGDADALCGNHNWLEAWVPGRGWGFVDQRPADLSAPPPPLNTSWFYPAQSQLQIGDCENHTIFAASFADPRWLEGRGYWGGAHARPAHRFPMVWDWASDGIHAWDVSRVYAEAAAARAAAAVAAAAAAAAAAVE